MLFKYVLQVRLCWKVIQEKVPYQYRIGPYYNFDRKYHFFNNNNIIKNILIKFANWYYLSVVFRNVINGLTLYMTI